MKMKHVRPSQIFSFFVYFSLLVAPLPLSAMSHEITTNIAQCEIDFINQDADVVYIDLSKEYSNIAEIIFQISDLDEKNDSILHSLQRHIEDGFSIAEYSVVVETLEYAETVLQKNYAQLETADAERIVADLNEIIHDVINGSLIRRPTRVINKNIDVLGKTTLRKHLHTKQGAHIEGNLKVCKNAKFKDDVIFKENVDIDGILSTANLV